jgi:exosortase
MSEVVSSTAAADSASLADSGGKPVAGFHLEPREWLAAGVLFLATLWSYWPNFLSWVHLWENNPDYSHGFVVPLIVVGLLWLRMPTFPEKVQPAVVPGLALVLASLAVRTLAALYFYEPFDNWTLIGVISGMVLTLGGKRVLAWAFPVILFLAFAMPLPYRVEIMMRQPLQKVVTYLGSMLLVMSGQIASPQANVIRMGSQEYGVEEACAGLRIFVGIAALAYAIVVASRGSWQSRLGLLLMVLPVALAANVLRVVLTCLALSNTQSGVDKQFAHDTLGFLMIPFAAVLLGGALWLLQRIFREEKIVESSTLFAEKGSSIF